MAELITVARPYARAAFESASAAAQLGAWGAFLERAAALIVDAQLAQLIGNPRVPAGQLVELVLELATATPPAAQPGTRAAAPPAAHLLEEQRNFLALLAHNRRLALLPQIAAQYEALRAQAEHIADVDVASARELTAEQSAKLKAALEQRLGHAVRLHARVDPALLGGAVVRYGDFVVDGSLRRRVERLAADIGGA
ncbi:MAG TPA: F0F1 ATP synthase subunit delta [Steroidobacteraceae bacterium]|jgi:F-type H+-transporting ATPase subunit delta|nr:F0F1 ATP synthase subunit delta [Steroidobacteraceae bacterium]